MAKIIRVRCEPDDPIYTGGIIVGPVVLSRELARNSPEGDSPADPAEPSAETPPKKRERKEK